MANEKKDKIVIGVVVDASEAQDGLKRVEQASQQSAQKIKESFKGAGEGIGSVGAGGEESAAKVDRSTKSIIGSIQRATAQMESGGKAGAKYYEILANQRGIPLDALRPYIDQLKKVEQAQGNVGVSAAQTAAAMRSVPAQFTDIITSLQGGQKPLTVLIQQGGQLKDMFGGVGNAAKALGEYVFGLVSPFTLTAAAVGGVAYSYSQANETAKTFQKTIIMSGNAAGTTSGQMIQLAKDISAIGAGSVRSANDAVNALVATGKVSYSILESATMSAVKAQDLLGKSVEDTAKEFADLGKTPTKSITDLNEKYNFLTIDIYRQIKALEDQGRTTDAASLAQKTYSNSLLENSNKVNETLTDWERGWIRIKKATSDAADAALRVFDEDTNKQKIDSLMKQRKQIEDLLKSAQSNGDTGLVARYTVDLDQYKRQILILRDVEDAKVRNAKAQADLNNAEKAGIKFAEQGNEYMSKSAKLQKELLEATNLYLAGSTEKNKRSEEDAELTTRLAQIREKYKESLSKEENAYRSLTRAIDQKLALSSLELNSEKALTEGQKLRVKLVEVVEQSHGKITQAQILEQTKKIELIRANELLRASYIDLDKDLGKLKLVTANDIAISISKQDKAYSDIIVTQKQYRQSLQDNADLMQLEANLSGQSAIDRNTAIEQYKIEIALNRELLKIKEDVNLSESRKRELSNSAVENANLAKSQAALTVQQQEWTKFYDDIYNGLSDSLYRGFEAGKGFFQSFWDGIKNLFKTTVLKLAVQGVMTGIIGVGVSGQASASPLGDATSLLSSGKTIYEGFASGFSGFGDGVTKSVQAALDKSGLSMSSGTPGTFASGAGTVASYGMGIAAGVYGGRAISGGYSVGDHGNALVNVGTAAGAIFGGPIGAAIGGAIAGGINRAFGMSEKVMGGQTVTGTLGTDNLMRNQPWTQDGGYFRSDKSGVWSYGLKDSIATTSDGKSYVDSANLASDKELLKILNGGYDAIKAASVDFAKTLGVNADSISTRSDALNLTLGKTAEENKKAIVSALGVVADSIAISILPNINELKKEGESAGTALARVAVNFGSVNSIFKDLNFILFKSSEAGIKAASSFVDMFGGLENLQAASASYFENFYSEEERLKAGREKLAVELGKAGVGTITTREGFRDAVTNADKTGNTEQLAALLKLNNVFAQLYPSIDKSAEAAEKLRLETDAANLAAQKQQAILSERSSLQDELNRLTLTDVQLLALQRAALDESNTSLFDTVQATKQKQAAEAQAAVAAQAEAAAKKQAADELASVNKSVQDQINQLVNAGQTLAQQRANELTGLDATTAALKEQLFALQDQAAAAQSAKQSADALASANATIQQQLDNLLKAQLPLEKQREIELAGMASSTAEIQKRIYALQDETAAAQTAKQAADALANINRSLQQQIDSQLKSQLPLAQQRELEVQGMDASTKALQLRIYALTDEATAAAAAQQAAQALASVNASVQQQIDQMVNAGLTLEQQRAREIVGLDASTVALKQRLFALQDEATAAAQAAEAKKAAIEKQTQAEQAAQSQYQSWVSELKSAFDRESGVFRDVISQFTDLAQSMKDYAQSLSTGPAAMLSPKAQYDANREQFFDVSTRARAGDKDALTKLQQVSEAFRESSLKYNATNKGYFDDLELIRKATADSIVSAYAQVDVAKLQLALLEKSVSGLTDINNTLKTVAQLLAGQFSSNGSATSNREAGQLSILEGYGDNVKQGLANVGGFDSLYSKTVAGDAGATKALQDQMVRWAQFGLDTKAMDQLVGKDSLKKLLELFNLRIEDFRSSALTSWDGKEQKLNFDRNGLFTGTTSYAKIADDLKAMQEAERIRMQSSPTSIYSGNAPDIAPRIRIPAEQLTNEEQIRVLKQTNELIAALVNQTANDGRDNVSSLAKINKRLEAIESAGGLLGAQP